MRKKFLALFILLTILMLVALPLVSIKYRTSSSPASPSNDIYNLHVLGGFSIDNPEQAANAAENGIQVAFEYIQPPTEKGQLGQKLKSLHMKVIDGYISSYLYHYECHRTSELHPQLLGPGQYCPYDLSPSLTDANVLLAIIATHLKQVKNNPLIVGYWVLDDWVQWDAGSARPILMKIHQLIQQFTPGRPAICGFGGSIGLHQKYGWGDWIADNFSPRGCDEVGFYIYTPRLPSTVPAASPDAYNWSMSGVLASMFASLQKRGWSLAREPLIGIGQVFGGPIARTNDHWMTPTAKDIELQSRSFCERGASGLAFYAWDESGYGPGIQTPVNNTQIALGIRAGIAACKQYWGQHPPKIPPLKAN
jgi:hypothetical protein